MRFLQDCHATIAVELHPVLGTVKNNATQASVVRSASIWNHRRNLSDFCLRFQSSLCERGPRVMRHLHQTASDLDAGSVQPTTFHPALSIFQSKFFRGEVAVGATHGGRFNRFIRNSISSTPFAFVRLVMRLWTLTSHVKSHPMYSNDNHS